MENNYITIQGWMITKLNLSGNELITFALIFGFSQDGNSEFTGSLSYLCSWLNCSKPTAIRSLKELMKKGLIVKTEHKMAGMTFYRYKVQFEGGGKETLPVGGKDSLLGGSKETLPNNTTIDNTTNNTIDHHSDKSEVIDFEKLLKFINEKTGRNFEVINDAVRKKYKALLKQGYKQVNIKNAIENAIKVKSHIEDGFQYLTPEFFSRTSTMDKYGTATGSNSGQQATLFKPKTETYSR